MYLIIGYVLKIKTSYDTVVNIYIYKIKLHMTLLKQIAFWTCKLYCTITSFIYLLCQALCHILIN